MLKSKSLLILLGAMLILGLPIMGCPPQAEQPPEAQPEAPQVETGPQVGKLAPDFTLPTVDGQEISLYDIRGKVVLLNFWATWCPPCRAQQPHLIAAYNDFIDQGLVILAVNVRESEVLVRSHVIEKGIPFPVLLDTEGEVANLYQVRGFPTTFLIDRQGVIQEVRIGAFRNAADVAVSVGSIFEE